jgi:hypothetical protein
MAKAVFKTTKRRPASDLSQELTAGEYLFREGEIGTEMYILQDGQVEILKTLGGEDKQLAVLEKGDFFGEMSLLEDLPRTASARTLVPCKVLKINGTTFDQMLRSNPEIAVRMMRKLSRRLRETDRLLQEAVGVQADLPEVPPIQKKEEPGFGAERLVHPKSGMDFHLVVGTETTVGRRDPVTGIQPDVDLSPVDAQRTTSRRHAKVQRVDGGYYVMEEIGTMNGTFVNGVRVETGVPEPVKSGDEVQFGLVKMIFLAE